MRRVVYRSGCGGSWTNLMKCPMSLSIGLDAYLGVDEF